MWCEPEWTMVLVLILLNLLIWLAWCVIWSWFGTDPSTSTLSVPGAHMWARHCFDGQICQHFSNHTAKKKRNTYYLLKLLPSHFGFLMYKFPYMVGLVAWDAVAIRLTKDSDSPFLRLWHQLVLRRDGKRKTVLVKNFIGLMTTELTPIRFVGANLIRLPFELMTFT